MKYKVHYRWTSNDRHCCSPESGWSLFGVLILCRQSAEPESAPAPTWQSDSSLWTLGVQHDAPTEGEPEVRYKPGLKFSRLLGPGARFSSHLFLQLLQERLVSADDLLRSLQLLPQFGHLPLGSLQRLPLLQLLLEQVSQHGLVSLQQLPVRQTRSVMLWTRHSSTRFSVMSQHI